MAIQDTVTIPVLIAGNVSGPASYAAGGFLIDLTASVSFIRFLSVEIEVEGSIVSDEYEALCNRDLSGNFAPGKAVVKLLMDRYDKTTIGSVSGNPSGTTVQAALAQAATITGSSHGHGMNHDHPSATSSTPTAISGGVNAAVGGNPNMSGHSHAVDIPLFIGGTGLTEHTHQRAFEYEHSHSIGTVTETNATLTEVSAGTNLSTTTFRYFAVCD